MIITVKQSLRYRSPDGTYVTLQPGVDTRVPDKVAFKLHARFPDLVELDEPVIDPALCDPPIRPGAIVAFFHERTFHGGPQGGMAGEVIRAVFDNEWLFFTAGGWKLRARDVYRVWPVDPRTGAVMPAVKPWRKR